MSLTLLEQRDDRTAFDREMLRREVVNKLRQGLKLHLPNQAVWVYGSILVPYKFSIRSDIDIALEEPLETVSIYLLQSLLTEATGHEVDISYLEETRLRKKIESHGERWIESA